MWCESVLENPSGRLVLSLVISILLVPTVNATTRYFEPADGIGPWNYGPYWSPSGVPVAGDTARIEAGGSGWTLYCNYVNATNPLLASVYIGNLDTGTAEARIVQGQDALHTGYEYCGYRGVGKHFQSGGTVTVDNTLYLGRLSGSYGYYELSGGTLTATYPHIGYGGAGDFVQTGGTFTCTQMNIANANYAGPYDAGSYDMQIGTLNAPTIYIGGKDEGTFTQSGGTVNATDTGITLGLDQYGGGFYTLSGGDLNTYRTRLSWGGSTFTQSGGTHDITNDLEVGYGTAVPDESLYTLSGTGLLNVGDDLYLGQSGHAAQGRFRQTGGTADVTDMLVLAEPTGTFQLVGGTFTCADVSNDGHYWQSGGTLTTNTWTNTYDFQQTGGILNAQQCWNNSAVDMTIDGTADCRINSLNGNTGRIWLKSGRLRGTYAGGGVYNMCQFTNAATFEMDAGEFVGHLNNNGTFKYDGGTFAQSTFTNYAGYGLVTLNANFTCRRVVNHGSLTLYSNRWITADGLGYANAVENNGTLSMYPSSHIDVGNNSTLVNNGPMYAGGPGSTYAHVYGDVVNNNYLLPSHSGLPTGHLYVNGDFTASSGAELRIRIHGTTLDDYDRLSIQETATLAGKLDVRLTSGFVPSAGDSFTPIGYSSRSGTFSNVSLPTLLAGLEWDVKYLATMVQLDVVEQGGYETGDLNCDGDINGFDIDAFVLALQATPPDYSEYYAVYPDCDVLLADINEDGEINGFDIDPFVDLLIGS
ncbi:MAG: hypothetical protein KKB50_02720 [Planctomycetes bacterium]|nr:hypothetical protein [Planctomycetota bacterium]